MNHQASIFSFLNEQSCATICCVNEQGLPHCFNCYYTFNEEHTLIYFKSSPDSSHSTTLKTNPVIAGCILPDKLHKLVVQGIQFEGRILYEEDQLAKDASLIYHKHNPLALAKAGHVWTIQINSIKMTDSTLGFGKKIVWERDVLS